MQVLINRKLSRKVTQLSSLFGWKKEEIVTQALLYYMDTVFKQLSLQKELNTWDKLSDETLTDIEKGK
jgi:hypothetical protein